MQNPLILLLLAVVGQFQVAFAARESSVPHIVRRTILSYAPAGGGVPNKLGAVLTVGTFVKNISTVSQRVTFVLDQGTVAYASTTQAEICLTVTGNNAVNNGSGVATINGGQELTFSQTIAASGSYTFVSTAVFKSLNSFTDRNWSVVFQPIVKIIVDEDRGALNATITMHSEGNASVSSNPNCNANGTAEPLPFSAIVSGFENLASPIIAMNGGRPF